jgi:hypothetical protein
VKFIDPRITGGSLKSERNADPAMNRIPRKSARKGRRKKEEEEETLNAEP